MKDIKNTNKELATQPAIVMPAVNPKEAVEAWKAYQALKQAIATKDDVQSIQGKEFFKKSYWRKIATFFNLSVEITSEQKEELGNNDLIYSFTQKAIAPNGRFAYGTGSCNRLEKGRLNTIHNTRTTAETRAFNRAVSNLVGGGEVSAEEIDSVDIQPDNDTLVTKPQQSPLKPTTASQGGQGNGTSKPTFYKEKRVSMAQETLILKQLARTGKRLVDITQGKTAHQSDLTMQEASSVIKILIALPNKKEETLSPVIQPSEVAKFNKADKEKYQTQDDLSEDDEALKSIVEDPLEHL